MLTAVLYMNDIPSRADSATKNMASGYRWCHQAANAAVHKYIENELGNSAVLAVNMPGLNNWNNNHRRPI